MRLAPLPPPPQQLQNPNPLNSASAFLDPTSSVSKIRVLFYNDWGASWEALEPIANALLTNPVFEIIVLAMPSRVTGARFYDLGASQSLREFAAKMQCQVIMQRDLAIQHLAMPYLDTAPASSNAHRQNLLCIIGFDELGLESMADLSGDRVFDVCYLSPCDCRAHYCFTTRPYNELRPEPWHSKRIALTSKLCYVEYGIHAFGLHEDNGSIIAYHSDHLRYYDYLFSPTAFHAAVAQSQQHGDSLLRIQVTGSARFEELIAYATRDLDSSSPAVYTSSIPSTEQSCQESSHTNHARKLRVLYLPRWSPEDLHSTFLHYMKPLLDLAKSGKISLHFRPHPNLYVHLVHGGRFMTQAQWNELQNDIRQYGYWDESHSILESFARADVLVSDTSSMLIYAFLSGKPTIYTQGSFKAEPNSWALRVVQGCLIASSIDDLLGLLARFCDDYEATAALRGRFWQEIVSQNFYLPESTSAGEILGHITKDYAYTIRQFHPLNNSADKNVCVETTRVIAP
ncbi:hypothetical protein [Helicobacter sp.]|uniref:hypothetical protein n=1 Tax=Helicobacter sp. TaxID=218 RepID=UPI00388F7AF4